MIFSYWYNRHYCCIVPIDQAYKSMPTNLERLFGHHRTKMTFGPFPLDFTLVWKFVLKNMASTSSMLSSTKSCCQRTYHGLRNKTFKTKSTNLLLGPRDETRMYDLLKCHLLPLWLVALSVSYEDAGSFINKNQWYNRWVVRHLTLLQKVFSMSVLGT